MVTGEHDQWNGLVRNEWIRSHPWVVTTILTLIAYVLVFGTFFGWFVYPQIGRETVQLLSMGIAVINATAFVLLAAGWFFIRNGRVRRHRQTMLGGVTLILLFLVLYLEKVGGGGIKEFVGPTWVETYIYFPLLGIHEILSAIAVPFVVYTLVIGLTHSVTEIPSTYHRLMGRIAAALWLGSLFLGVLNFVFLEYYGWTYTSQLPF